MEDANDPRRAIEAILMVAEDPVEPHLLAQLLELTPRVVERICTEMAAAYESERRGFILARVAGGYRFQSAPDLAPYLERFVLEGQSSRLSSAALETLAIVAYKQPLSRAQVAAIRGVNVDGVMRTLQQRGYITEVGRDPGPGQALLFGTTDSFLTKLGLDSVDDLPPLGAFVPGPEVMEALEHGLRVQPEGAAEEPVGDDPPPEAVEPEQGGDADAGSVAEPGPVAPEAASEPPLDTDDADTGPPAETETDTGTEPLVDPDVATDTEPPADADADAAAGDEPAPRSDDVAIDLDDIPEPGPDPGLPTGAGGPEPGPGDEPPPEAGTFPAERWHGHEPDPGQSGRAPEAVGTTEAHGDGGAPRAVPSAAEGGAGHDCGAGHDGDAGPLVELVEGAPSTERDQAVVPLPPPLSEGYDLGRLGHDRPHG